MSPEYRQRIQAKALETRNLREIADSCERAWDASRSAQCRNGEKSLERAMYEAEDSCVQSLEELRALLDEEDILALLGEIR